MIVIRASRPEDRGGLFRIWHDAVRATHTFLSEEDFHFFAGLVRDQYIPVNAFRCAVDARDRPIGFIGMTGNKIDALFVAPDRHRQGVGRLLLDCARADHPRLLLDVNEQNPGAVAFYERQGFRHAGRSERDDSGRPYPLLHMVLEEGA